MSNLHLTVRLILLPICIAAHGAVLFFGLKSATDTPIEWHVFIFVFAIFALYVTFLDVYSMLKKWTDSIYGD